MITQTQTEAFFAIEHLYQCSQDFIQAVNQAKAKWNSEELTYSGTAEVISDLSTMEAFALILKNVNVPSFKPIHIIAQHLEEF